MTRNILVIPDVQVKPGVDISHIVACGKYLVEKQPDIIVCLGDFFDFPSLSSYDKGTLSFEGRRLIEDIEAGKLAMHALLEPLRNLQAQQRANKKKVYSPRMVFTLGNHCIAKDTEVLTATGWVLAENISKLNTLATVNLSTNMVEYAQPEDVWVVPGQDIYSVVGDNISEVVSEGHSIIFDNKRTVVSTLEGKHSSTHFKYCADNTFDGVAVTDELLKVLVWTVMDGCLVQGESLNKKRVQFKLSKPRKIERLKNILDAANIPYTFAECKKTGINKLQPYYFRIYGDYARNIFSMLGGVKVIPDSWRFLNKQQLDSVLEEITHTDGCAKENRITLTTVSKSCADILQIASLQNGIPCSIKSYTNSSGFENGKKQYRVVFKVKGNYTNRRKVKINKEGYCEDVVGISIKNSTLICRRDGKAYITGNCERLRRIPNASPELEGFIGYELLELDKFGWEAYDFLEPVEIEGIFFSHYFANPFSGKPYSGTASNILKTIGRSFVAGHKQILDVAMRPTIDGKMQLGIVAGAFYSHNEGYKGYTGNNHWRGMFMLHNVKDGFGDPCFISLEYLVNRYKGV